MVTYDEKHWEQLIATIVERIGVDKFLDHVVYVLEQSGYESPRPRLDELRYLQVLSKADDD